MMQAAQIPLFMRSIIHISPRQLWHRVRLTAKRRFMVRYAPTNGRNQVQSPFPTQRASGIRPLFPPRSHLAEVVGSDIYIRIAGENRKLTVPVDWNPPELEHGTRLQKLNLHYMEWLEGVDDQFFEATVGDWIRRNRPYGKEYWLGSWNSYALSIRVVVWLQQLYLRRDLSECFRELVSQSICEQLNFLCANIESDIEGNHLVKNAKALILGARSVSGRLGSRWAGLGEKLLASILDKQILPDGVHYELSASYHAQVLADLLEIGEAMRNGVLSDRLRHSTDNMRRALGLLTHPDGGPVLFGDAGLNSAYSLAQIMECRAFAAAEVLPPDGGFSLTEAGYYGFRNRETFLILKAGRLGPPTLPAHSHADLLSFELSLWGRRIVVDAGVSKYDTGEARDFSRCTAAHNTLTLDGGSQCEMWGSFRIGRRCRARVAEWTTGPESIFLSASHDGYSRLRGRPVHQRLFSLSDNRLRVIDSVMGGGGQVAEARLLLHPDVKATYTPKGLELVANGHRALFSCTVPFELRDSTWMPDFGVERSTQQIVIQYGKTPTERQFSIYWGCP